MANPNDRNTPEIEDEETGASRDAGAAHRIDQRREQDKEISRREDEGYDQPQSSAQKDPSPGPRP